MVFRMGVIDNANTNPDSHLSDSQRCPSNVSTDKSASELYIYYIFDVIYILYTYYIHIIYILYTYYIHIIYILYTYYIHIIYYTYYIILYHIILYHIILHCIILY